MFWLGYGQRSDAAARHAVEEMFGIEVTPLELADPRFYHMDTALSALPRGEVMYVPEAFTAAGLATIRARVPRGKRIEVGIEDASKLAANAVCLGDTLVMAGCGDRLRATLEERGYQVAVTPLRSFLRSGGAAFCLTLRLDRQLEAGHRDRAGRGRLSRGARTFAGMTLAERQAAFSAAVASRCPHPALFAPRLACRFPSSAPLSFLRSVASDHLTGGKP